jgi:serine/threonine-protein kinase RsbW
MTAPDTRPHPLPAPATTGPPPERVELRVPADPAYLAVIRTATAGLATRLDLTLDAIEDLRIAVDEACAMLLPTGHPRPTGELLTTFTVDTGQLDVLITGPRVHLPAEDTFAWAVLRALTGQVTTGRDRSGSWIRLRYSPAEGSP